MPSVQDLLYGLPLSMVNTSYLLTGVVVGGWKKGRKVCLVDNIVYIYINYILIFIRYWKSAINCQHNNQPDRTISERPEALVVGDFTRFGTPYHQQWLFHSPLSKNKVEADSAVLTNFLVLNNLARNMSRNPMTPWAGIALTTMSAFASYASNYFIIRYRSPIFSLGFESVITLDRPFTKIDTKNTVQYCQYFVEYWVKMFSFR